MRSACVQCLSLFLCGCVLLFPKRRRKVVEEEEEEVVVVVVEEEEEQGIFKANAVNKED